MFLSIFSAVLQFLSFPPAEFYYFAFVALIPLFVFLHREQSIGKIIAGILVYRALFLVLAGSYIPDPLLLFFELIFFIPLIILIIILKRYQVRSSIFLPIVALAYFMSECFAARFAPLPSFVVLSELPLAATPFVYLAKWGGVYATSAFAVLINTLFSAIAILFYSKNSRKISYITFLIFTILIISFLGYNSNKIAFPNKSDTNAGVSNKKSIRLAIISTGGAYDDGSKIETDKEGAYVKLNALANKTLGEASAKIGDFRPDLVVLPEHFIDLLLLDDMNIQAREKFGIVNAGTILSRYQSFAKKEGTAVLAPLKTYGEDRRKRQTAILIDKDGNFRAVSNKYYLTTGSETWPFGRWIPFYFKWSLKFLPKETREEAFIALSPTGQFVPAGNPFSPIALGDITLAPLLCSEGHYPLAYQTFVQKGADIFISDSNNTWLSFSTNQYQKETLWLRKLYAVSSGKPIVISGKNDLAGIIYPDGAFTGVFPQKTDTLVLFTKELEL